MHRFFFNLRDEDGLKEDTEGALFPGLDEARSEALASGKAAIADHMMAGGRLSDILERRIEITDEGGRVLLVVSYGEAAEIDDHRP